MPLHHALTTLRIRNNAITLEPNIGKISELKICALLNEEAGYKRAAPRAEVMFKMHMAYT